MPARRPHIVRATLLVALVIAPLALWGSLPVLSSAAPSEGQLRDSISGSKAREGRLASSAARLDRLVSGLQRSIGALERREADVQSNLDAAQGRLAQTRDELRAERAHLERLRARLVDSRVTLSRQLRADYTSTKPSLVSVVLASRGFADLLEKAEFYRRVAHASASVIDAVRDAKNAARSETFRLGRLERRRTEVATAVARQRAALAQMHGLLESRRSALASALATQRLALRNTRRSRGRAERALRKLEAAQARAAVSNIGPGGPWAIPWIIVQCESGGQNLPPNSATASGYYQFIDDTWKGLGGSTTHAFQAPKAEQDRLAARLWAGGSGARNWDCASIVGAI